MVEVVNFCSHCRQIIPILNSHFGVLLKLQSSYSWPTHTQSFFWIPNPSLQLSVINYCDHFVTLTLIGVTPNSILTSVYVFSAYTPSFFLTLYSYLKLLFGNRFSYVVSCDPDLGQSDPKYNPKLSVYMVYVQVRFLSEFSSLTKVIVQKPNLDTCLRTSQVSFWILIPKVIVQKPNLVSKHWIVCL